MGKKAEEQRRSEKKARAERTWIHEGPFIKLRQDVIYAQEGSPKTWELVFFHGAVGVVPINSKGNLILVEQWRRAPDQMLIEIPAGIIDPGEEPLECAQRELQEEIGYKAQTLIPLGGCYPSPGSTDEYVHLFVAKDLEESYLKAEDTDFIDIVEVPIKEALKWIEEGKICDAKTIIGILRCAFLPPC